MKHLKGGWDPYLGSEEVSTPLHTLCPLQMQNGELRQRWAWNFQAQPPLVAVTVLYAFQLCLDPLLSLCC
jgi:hypothetical protein